MSILQILRFCVKICSGEYGRFHLSFKKERILAPFPKGKRSGLTGASVDRMALAVRSGEW